jgi:hypothetical protein
MTKASPNAYYMEQVYDVTKRSSFEKVRSLFAEHDELGGKPIVIVGIRHEPDHCLSLSLYL